MSELVIIGVNVNELNDSCVQELQDENSNCAAGAAESPAETASAGAFLEGDVPVTGNLRQELEKICRCCASEMDGLNSIFDPNDYIASMLTLLTAIQPSRDDGLPSKICLHCLDMLVKSTNFKQRVETADRMFRNLLAMDLCQTKELQKADVEQLAKSLSKMNELDMIILGSDLKLPQADNIAYIEENSLEIDKPEDEEDELMQTPQPSPDEDSSAESANEEIHIEDHQTGDDDIKDTTKLPKTRKSRRKDRSAFQCSVCEEKFIDPKMYLSHVNIHPETKALYWCTLCSRNFRNRSSMEHHFRCHRTKESEDSPKEFKCNDCDMSFSVADDLYIHGSIHETGDKFICRKCDKEFPNCVKLKRHVRIHFEDKPYKCEMCGKGFPEMASLTRHFRFHTGEKKERKHICNTCGKRYYDKNSLSVHKRTHTGEKPWVCKECGKGFIDCRLLNSHLKTHKSEKMYACTICGKRFTHQSTLTTHIRVHTGEKPYVCYICHKSFVQSSNLNLHMRVHSGERPYQCKLCPRAFASSSTLTTHLRTHTGEKPYVCPQCGKSFARHDLSAHIRTHTGEKPFICEICSRRFTTLGQLNQHKRCHSDEKPYKCEICDKSWSTPGYHKKHMKIHYDDKSLPADKLNESAENARVFEDQDDEFQSDTELNEHAVLVNDLLAAVVENSVDNKDNQATETGETSESNILKFQ